MDFGMKSVIRHIMYTYSKINDELSMDSFILEDVFG